MTEADTMDLLAYLAAAYPASTVRPDTTAVWTEALADVDAVAAMLAARRLVKTGTFFPSIAELRGSVHTMGLPTVEEAWQLARAAITDHPFLDILSVSPEKPLPVEVHKALRGMSLRDIRSGSTYARTTFDKFYLDAIAEKTDEPKRLHLGDDTPRLEV
jgi:hypothetical protein